MDFFNTKFLFIICIFVDFFNVKKIFDAYNVIRVTDNNSCRRQFIQYDENRLCLFNSGVVTVRSPAPTVDAVNRHRRKRTYFLTEICFLFIRGGACRGGSRTARF